MSAPVSRPRRRTAVPVAGGVLIVTGVAIAMTGALRFLYFGPRGLDVVQVPNDASPPQAPIFLTSSIVVGAALALIGIVMVAAWCGFVAGSRRS